MVKTEVKTYTLEVYDLTGKLLRIIECLHNFRLPKIGNFDRRIVGGVEVYVKWVS